MAGHEEPTQPARKRAAKKTEKHADNPYAAFDRSQLGPKTRVFALAKALGVPSKELVVALSELGVVKVAQSTLTRAESEQLLDALANPTADGADTDDAAAADDGADKKIRERVRKDVENEIHQIEEKVEADLRDSAEGDPLTDVEPEVTPVPEDAANRAPLFKAPERKRRRATRAAAPTHDESQEEPQEEPQSCLLYTSDAADE